MFEIGDRVKIIKLAGTAEQQAREEGYLGAVGSIIDVDYSGNLILFDNPTLNTHTYSWDWLDEELELFEYKVGDKVTIPKTKSYGDPIERSSAVATALAEGKKFLYITRIMNTDGNKVYVLWNDKNRDTGDYFLAKDFTPYVEERKEEKVEQFKVEDKVKVVKNTFNVGSARNNYIGKTGTIDSIYNKYRDYSFIIKFDDVETERMNIKQGRWIWSADELALIPNTFKIPDKETLHEGNATIIINYPKTIYLIRENGIVFRGIATFDERDNEIYDKENGIKIARLKAERSRELYNRKLVAQELKDTVEKLNEELREIDKKIARKTNRIKELSR